MSKLLKSKFLLGVMAVAIMFVGVVAVSTTASADCTVVATVRVGSSGANVQCVQTIVGATADGSFGPLTKAAVMAWQSGHDLTADGVVGPLTAAAMNAGGAVSGNFPAGCSSASGYSTVTGLACTSLASNGPCSGGAAFNSVTGVSCSASLPAGCTSTSAFSSTTGLSCSGSTATVSANGEGSVTVTYDAVPANNLAVNRGEEKAVMAVKVKATGSDMNVSRIWLDINTRIWLSAESVSLLDGSTVLATIPLSASTVVETTVGSAWQIQFNGLNITVPKDATKVLTFKVKRPTLTNADSSVTIAATSTLRATDSAGISNTYTLSLRTWNMAAVAASAGTLTASLSSTSPLAQSVGGLSTTAGDLTDVKLMDFDLKATNGPINVSLISGTLTATTCTAVQCVASTELRDGTDVLASVTGAATFSFSALNIDIATGATKKLSVWAKVNHIATSYVVKGDSLIAAVTAVTATTGTTFTSASITPTVTGNAQYLFQYAPTFALGAVSATQADGSAVGEFSANFSLAFTVTAPSDSDIYVDATDGLLCGSSIGTPITKIAAACSNTAIGGAMTTGAVIVSGASSKGTGTLATWDKVSMGQSRTFTITGHVADGGSAAGFVYASLATNGIQWTDTDNVTIAGVATTEQTWGLTDFKTPSVYVTT